MHNHFINWCYSFWIWICLHAFSLQRQNLNGLVSFFCENILVPGIQMKFFFKGRWLCCMLRVIFAEELISVANTFLERRSSVVIIFHLGGFRFYRGCKTYYSTFNICLLLDIRTKVEKFKFYLYVAALRASHSSFFSFGFVLKTIVIRHFVSRNANASNRG